MFLSTENKFWLKLLLLNALKNKVFICQLFSLSVRVHFRGNPKSRLSTWEDPVLLSKSQEQGIQLVTVQQSLQAKDVNIRRLIQSFLAVDTKFVEIVMSLIILTSGNKI